MQLLLHRLFSQSYWENKHLQQESRATLKIAYPLILSELGIISAGVIDTIMVGQLGAEQLGGAAIANIIFSTPLLFATGISDSVTAVTAIARGRKKSAKRLTEIKSNIFLFSFIIGVAFMLLTLLGIFLIPVLNSNEMVITYAGPYLAMLALSFIPLMYYDNFCAFLQGVNVVKPILVFTLISIPVNTFFNWLLIYGNWGFPRLEVMGAGIATLITTAIIAISILLYIRYSKKIKQLLAPKTCSSQRINYVMIRRILKLGVPTGFYYALESLAFAVTIVMIGWVGVKELAADEIVANLLTLTFAVSTGISSATTIRAGEAIGQENFSALRAIAKDSFQLMLIIMPVFCLIFILFRHELVDIYIDDQAVIEIAGQFMLVAAFYMLADAVLDVGANLLRCMGDVVFTAIATVISYWLIGIPFGALLTFYFEIGAIGIWIGMLVSVILSAITLCLRFFYLLNKRRFKQKV